MMDLKNMSTSELFEELRIREGVQDIPVAPYVDYTVHVDEHDDTDAVDIEGNGIAHILIIMD